MGDTNNNQSLNNNQYQHHTHQPGSSSSSNGVSGGVATANNAVYKPVPPPKPLSSPPTYRMPPPPTGAALYNEQQLPPIPGATCSNYEMQSNANLRTHSSKFPVSKETQSELVIGSTFNCEWVGKVNRQWPIVLSLGNFIVPSRSCLWLYTFKWKELSITNKEK